MSIDSEAKGGKKGQNAAHFLVHTRANITHNFFLMQLQLAMRNTSFKVTSKKQEMDDFFFYLG